MDYDAVIAAVRDRVELNPDIQGIVQCDTEAQVGAMVHLIDLLRDGGHLLDLAPQVLDGFAVPDGAKGRLVERYPVLEYILG